MYEQQTRMLTIGLLNRNTGCQCCSVRCASVSERHLGFSKVENFNFRYASSYQISWRSVETLQTSESGLGKKGQKPQNLQKWVLGAVRGHSRSLAMLPLLDHTWFLVVISSNDRAILYSYRDIARYYFPTPRINYRDLRHYLTDPYQILWTCRLIIIDEHYCFRFSIFLPHYEWRRVICCDGTRDLAEFGVFAPHYC